MSAWSRLSSSPTSVLAVAIIARALLLALGEWQDTHLEVKYTDIDYRVFTDAAAEVSQGTSVFIVLGFSRSRIDELRLALFA
jgi:GPI mannosyltransferase 1 subunit M